MTQTGPHIPELDNPQSNPNLFPGGYQAPTNPFTQPPVIDTNPNHPYQAIPQYTPEQRSAQAQIVDTLNQYGLGSLANFAWQEYLNAIPIEQIFLDIRGTPEYKQRFPAMDYLAQQGRAINEGQYIQYEKTVSEKMRAAGLPPGFYDQPDDFTNFIKNDVSPDEIQSRVDLAKQAVYNSDPATLQALHDYYNINQLPGNPIGGATAFFLDDTRALPALQKQMLAAQEGGAATNTGYGALNQQEAEKLATLGVTQSQAVQGFGTLANIQQLFANLPGEAGATPTREQGQQAVFDQNAQAQQAIELQRSKRKAEFSAGGAFSSTQAGVRGVG